MKEKLLENPFLQKMSATVQSEVENMFNMFNKVTQIKRLNIC